MNTFIEIQRQFRETLMELIRTSFKEVEFRVYEHMYNHKAKEFSKKNITSEITFGYETETDSLTTLPACINFIIWSGDKKLYFTLTASMADTLKKQGKVTITNSDFVLVIEKD